MTRTDRTLAVLLALFFAANATAMIFGPAAWYASVPGIERSGPFNAHFVIDIGLAFLVSAAGFAWAAFHRIRMATVVFMAAAGPALHAGFHLLEWSHHGLPGGRALAGEAIGVVLPGALALALATRLNLRKEP